MNCQDSTQAACRHGIAVAAAANPEASEDVVVVENVENRVPQRRGVVLQGSRRIKLMYQRVPKGVELAGTIAVHIVQCVAVLSSKMTKLSAVIKCATPALWHG